MHEFVIKPNSSLSRRELIGLGGGFLLLMSLLAIRLWVMGLWLVVPFLLVDLLVVSLAFYLIRKKCAVWESIRIDGTQLSVHHHELKRSRSWSFDLHWVQVTLQQHEHPWQPSRLLLGSHGKWIEFAGFLTDEERHDLSRALKLTIEEQLHNA